MEKNSSSIIPLKDFRDRAGSFRANFMTGEGGKKIFQAYLDKVKSEYGDAEILRTAFQVRRDEITGSNPYGAIVLNEILGTMNLRVADPNDLERIIFINSCNVTPTLSLDYFYLDSALALRDKGRDNINPFIAEGLFSQVKEKNSSIEFPVVIPLGDLRLEKTHDLVTPYNLLFKLKEEARIISAPQLSDREGMLSLRKFSYADENGLPILGEKGPREIAIRKDGRGLFRYCLSGSKIISTHLSNLISSDENGRIVVVET